MSVFLTSIQKSFLANFFTLLFFNYFIDSGQ
jgi:hypothetical protein